MKVKKVIIPAAGLGTRFLPATKAQPKEMLPIVDKPTIQYIVEEAVKSGITDIMIISGRNKRAIEDHFDKSYELEDILNKKDKQDLLKIVKGISSLANIYYVRQKEPLGLGHAILCAKTFIGNEPFGIMLGDDIVVSEKPCLKQLIEVFNIYNSSVVGVQQVPSEDVSSYGIISGELVDNRIYAVDDMVEKPNENDAPSNIAILGRYVVTPKIFDLLEKTQAGKSGEIQLTDALLTLSKEEKVYAYDFVGKRYDVGKKMGYIEATIEIALSKPELKEPLTTYLKNLIKNL